MSAIVLSRAHAHVVTALRAQKQGWMDARMRTGWMGCYLRSRAASKECGRRMRSVGPRCCGWVRGGSSRQGSMLRVRREVWA